MYPGIPDAAAERNYATEVRGPFTCTAGDARNLTKVLSEWRSPLEKG